MATKVGKQTSHFLLRMSAWVRRPELWALFALTVLLSVALWWWSDPLANMVARGPAMRDWILEFGSLAPLAYIGIFALQILVAPLPGHFMAVMGGYLFGAGLGLLYSVAGLLLGAGLAMLIGRKFGRPLLERFYDPDQITLWEKKLRVRSPVTWALLFIFPIPDLIFYVAGLSSVPLRWLLTALLTGRGLGLLIANSMGHWTAHLAPEWVVVKWGIIAVLGALVYLYQRPLRLAILLSARRTRRWRRRWMPPA
jgi:uncharacterized membrane protein YdjX (TVP38/TMEM64 family)